MIGVPRMSRLHNSIAPRRALLVGGGLAALIVAAAAVPAPARADNSLVEPEVGASSTLPGMPPAPSGAPPIPATARQSSSPAAPAVAPQSASTTHAEAAPPRAATAEQAPAENTSPPAHGVASSGPASLLVVKWSLGGRLQGNPDGGLPAGQPLYLSLTVQGGQSAVDQLRNAGGIPIIVHWTRDDGGSTGKSAPDLTSELTIGRPGIAAALAGEVEHQGHFAWHTWTRKDTLTPGQWSVSLTYPDGAPVMCGQSAAEPCRFSINIG
jgi:hypothetical protein